MVPDTVQLIVLVAGLCSQRAPALDVTRPAGMAPRRSSPRNARPPVRLLLRRGLDPGQGARDALVGVVDRRIDDFAASASSGGTSCPRCRRKPAAADRPLHPGEFFQSPPYSFDPRPPGSLFWSVGDARVTPVVRRNRGTRGDSKDRRTRTPAAKPLPMPASGCFHAVPTAQVHAPPCEPRLGSALRVEHNIL